jgi:succinate-semialdehyde dehydrogenase
MARFDLRDELHQQVTATLAEGATLLLGRRKSKGRATTMRQRCWATSPPEMTGFRQELFGPVATITTARDAAHALTLANDSEFGLSATVFTASVDEAQRFPRAGVRRRLYQRLLRQRRAWRLAA